MFLIILGVSLIVAVFAALVYFAAPGKLSPEAAVTAEIFRGLYCAHRGLYTQDEQVPENSVAAFTAAREGGYGVELDVQLSRDGEVIVFHDDDLKRVCGVDALINSKDLNELSTMSLMGTKECIPLLTEVLKLLDDTPIIVELKTAGKNNQKLCEKVLEILRLQGKNYCIESFDPRIVRWFRKNAPDILRGQLSRPPKNMEGISGVTSFLLGNLLTNFMARPHFIAYENEKHSLTVKLCCAMKPMKVTWTIAPADDIAKSEKENDTLIFEFFKPKPNFK